MQKEWQAPRNDGIREHSSTASNNRIDRATQASIDATEFWPDKMRARISELDREWNIDRALMLNFAIISAFSASMAMRTLYRKRKLGGWAAMFFTQLAFLAHHAVRRWCPPMPLFRRLGFRSEREIDAERFALERKLELEHEIDLAVPAPARS